MQDSLSSTTPVNLPAMLVRVLTGGGICVEVGGREGGREEGGRGSGVKW